MAAARLSEAVYSEHDFRNLRSVPGIQVSFYMKDGPDDLDFGEADPTAGGEQVAWIVFAGSESAADWKGNINMLLSPAGHGLPGKVHKGIAKQWAAARGEVYKHFSELKKKGVRRVIFTGHSLGGGLAMMGAMEAKKKHEQFTVEIITFGAPVIGNNDYVRYMNTKFSGGLMTRVVNENDPIPCSAPSWWFCYDEGGLMFYDDSAKTWRNNRRRSCSDPRNWWNFSPSEHKITTYLDRLVRRCA
jgi:fermentation-respiration switch protein FrsA (DUF1100 family)